MQVFTDQHRGAKVLSEAHTLELPVLATRRGSELRKGEMVIFVVKVRVE